MQNSGAHSKDEHQKRWRLIAIICGTVVLVPLVMAILLGRTIAFDFRHGEAEMGVRIESAN